MDWSHLFVMLITFVFINNVVLNQFLGMCPFMGVSKKSSSAIGMGAAVTFVIVAASIVTYGLYYANSKVDYAYICFHKVKEMTILLAEVENSVYRLANTIRKTQKRANALRNISIPRFESTIKVISEALEEKEREEFTRQKVIKEMKR